MVIERHLILFGRKHPSTNLPTYEGRPFSIGTEIFQGQIQDFRKGGGGGGGGGG